MFFSWLQAFFCGRSDYFRALLEDHFSEGEQLQSHPSTLVITLHNISHEIFIHVMYYIYTEKTEVSALLLCHLFVKFTVIQWEKYGVHKLNKWLMLYKEEINYDLIRGA